MTQATDIVPALYPVVYTGPKEQKKQIIPGRNGPLVFNREPDGSQVAYATELEARWIAKNCTGGEFQFPKGLRNPDDKEDLWSRIEALTEQVAALTARVEQLEGEKPKRGRPAKAETEQVEAA